MHFHSNTFWGGWMGFVVQQVGKSLHLISDAIVRWRKILDEPHQEFLLSK